MEIVITDNRSEMIKYGKVIYEEKGDVYTPKMRNTILNSIKEIMPQATASELEELFYTSIYDYWAYGNNVSEEFYYNFSNKTHQEKSSYITFRNRFLYVWHLNDKKDAHILNNKYEAYLRLKKYYQRDIIRISTEADYSLFLDFVQKHPVFVVKPESLGLAVGVHKEHVVKHRSPKELFKKLLLEIEETKDRITWAKENESLVLEELVEQDENLGIMHPQSVNIVRATTVRVNGKIHFYCPWIKFGASGGFVASAGCGGYSAGIDENTGVIWSDGYRENGEIVKQHPDTGVAFKGFQIPRWQEAVKLAFKLAEAVPELGYVGWDFALTPKGWCVIEGNFAGEFIWQMWHQRGMKKEFEELIGWAPKTQFWWDK